MRRINAISRQVRIKQCLYLIGALEHPYLTSKTMDQHFDYERVRKELDSLITTRQVNTLAAKDSINDLSCLGLAEVCQIS